MKVKQNRDPYTTKVGYPNESLRPQTGPNFVIKRKPHDSDLAREGLRKKGSICLFAVKNTIRTPIDRVTKSQTVTVRDIQPSERSVDDQLPKDGGQR